MSPPQDQWKRKKQTKEQAKAARRGRLDPDSELNRTAKEVLDERARKKRKAQELDVDDEESNADEDDEEDAESELEGLEKELPGQGLKKRTFSEDAEHKANKKMRLSEAEPTEEPQKISAHQEKKLAKLQKKLDKKAEKKKNKPAKPAKVVEEVKAEEDDEWQQEEEVEAPHQDDQEDSHSDDDDDAVVPSKESEEEEVVPVKDKMLPIDISGLADEGESSQDSTPRSPTFDTNPPTSNPSADLASTTTSIASEAAPTERERKQIKVPADTTALRARLAARIAALRAARKADGPDGKPIHTRQDLIESRRKKQAERKAHKKELRLKAKETEDAKREEALASARNSPMLSFGSPEHDVNFSFGRVAFADGTQLSRDLSYAKDKKGKKGPLDPKSALAKLEAQKTRIEGMDADKRKEVLEKETWLAARRRADGEKVRDDVNLLKKAVKRKEKTKAKSSEEWADRKENVAYGQKQRAQKREDNIKQRRDQKAAGKAGMKKKGKPTSKKSRPGFEGGGFGGKRK